MKNGTEMRESRTRLTVVSIAAGVILLAVAALWMTGRASLLAGGGRSEGPIASAGPHVNVRLTTSEVVRLHGGPEREVVAGPVVSPPRNSGKGAIAIPDRARMESLAQRVACELWGKEVRLFDSQEQLGPGGRPMSYLFIFTVGEARETKEEILSRLASGVDPIAWDDRVRCLEMGAREDIPPVACHWNGLPPEYLSLREGQDRLRAKFGDRAYRLVRRHLMAAFPVLEFRAGEESYFFQPSTGRSGQGFELQAREGGPGDARGEARLAANRAQWTRFLARMND